jgi:MFS family permease
MNRRPVATPLDPAYPHPIRAWCAVGLLFIAAIIAYTDRQILSLLVDPVRHDLNISDTQIGMLMGTAFAIIYSIAGVPFGYLADRTVRRNLIAGGMLLWSVATIACGLSHDFAALFASRVAVGLGEAVLTPAAVSLISDCFAPERRATGLAVYFSGISIGVGAANLIGGGLLHAIDLGRLAATPLAGRAPWRLVFMLVGAPGLIWSMLIMTIREPVRRHVEPALAIGPKAAHGAARTASAQPGSALKLAPVFVAVAFASFVDNSLAAWSPSLLIREFHRQPSEVGLTLGALFTLGGAVGILAGGALGDRAARAGGWAGKVRLCLFAAAVDIPMLAGLTSSDAHLVLASITINFLTSGVITAVGLSAILDLTLSRRRGLATSISFFFNVAFGLGFGPTAVAMAGAGVFGAGAGLGPPLCLVAETGYLVISCAASLALLLRRRTRPPKAAAAADPASGQFRG